MEKLINKIIYQLIIKYAILEKNNYTYINMFSFIYIKNCVKKKYFINLTIHLYNKYYFIFLRLLTKKQF